MNKSNQGNEGQNFAEKGGEHALHTPGSASNLAVHLKGIGFPASRHDLLKHAKQNNAPHEIQEVINNLPDQSFSSMADVMAAWGRAKEKK